MQNRFLRLQLVYRVVTRYYIGILATNLIFLPIWKILPMKMRRRYSNVVVTWLTLLVSLVAWFVAAFIVTWLESYTSQLGIPLWVYSICIMLICVFVGIILCWSLPPTPKGKNKVSVATHLLRGLACMCCIFVSRWLSSSGLGMFAGAFSGFPAIFSTSIVSVSLAQGASVATGAVGPMIIGGCAYSMER